MRPGEEPIADDELLYRRVPASADPQRYDPTCGQLNEQAFSPFKNDTTGISIDRAKYKSIVDCIKGGNPGKTYFIAILHAEALRAAGILIEPRPVVPTGYDPAHAELPQLSYAVRKESKTLELQRELVRICGNNVQGPFLTPVDGGT